jgi:hypothetical protein
MDVTAVIVFLMILKEFKRDREDERYKPNKKGRESKGFAFLINGTVCVWCVRHHTVRNHEFTYMFRRAPSQAIHKTKRP